MVARQAQTIDRATLVYLKAQLEDQERKLPWLAKKIGMGYGNLYKYFYKGRPLRSGDLIDILDALQVDPTRAIRAIQKIAEELARDEVDDEQ